MITLEQLAAIEARASAAKAQCICDACLPPGERRYPDDHEDLREFHNVEDIPVLIAECKRLRAALEYIADHAWAAEKPKWGNEFVDVARDALNPKEQV